MGSLAENNRDFVLKEDGTIVRKRICQYCGKESFSTGDYCEHCGGKLNYVKGIDYEKHSEKWELVVLFASALLLGLGGVWLSFYANSVIENQGILYYRYDKDSRKIGIRALVLSVLSIILWTSVIVTDLYY